MNFLIEGIYWIKLFLSPVLVAILLMVVLSVWNGYTHWYLLLLVAGIIAGIWLAERIRRKYGTSNYYTSLADTPDLPESREVLSEGLERPGHTDK